MTPRYAFLETAVAPGDDRFSPLLRSSLAHRHRAAGARFEERDGWLVPASYPDAGDERRVVVADSSHVGKLEVRGGETPEDAAIADCVEVGPAQWVVLCRYAELAALHSRLAERAPLVVDRTSAWCALVLAGEAADELLGALSHVASLPARGPLGRVPATFLRRPSGIWILVSQEYAQYAWDLALDLAVPLEGGPAGSDDLAIPDPLLAAAAAHAA
jgi:hypothetical protein